MNRRRRTVLATALAAGLGTCWVGGAAAQARGKAARAALRYRESLVFLRGLGLTRLNQDVFALLADLARSEERELEALGPLALPATERAASGCGRVGLLDLHEHELLDVAGQGYGKTRAADGDHAGAKRSTGGPANVSGVFW